MDIQHLIGFRRKNWSFATTGGVLYVIAVLGKGDTWRERLVQEWQRCHGERNCTAQLSLSMLLHLNGCDGHRRIGRLSAVQKLRLLELGGRDVPKKRILEAAKIVHQVWHHVQCL